MLSDLQTNLQNIGIVKMLQIAFKITILLAKFADFLQIPIFTPRLQAIREDTLRDFSCDLQSQVKIAENLQICEVNFFTSVNSAKSDQVKA